MGGHTLRACGNVEVYAPAGLDDIAAMIVRPNLTANFSAEAYRIKAARWQALWPELTIASPCNIDGPSP